MRLTTCLRRLARTWDYLLAAPAAAPRRHRLGMEALEERDVPNGAPTAVDDSISLHNGSWGVDVLANDSDPDADMLTAAVYTNPSHGTVSVSGSTFDYSPDAGFVGSDWFEYEVSDGNGGTAVGKVDVSVWNTAPTGTNASISVHAGGSGEFMASGLVSDSESDTITFGVPATGGQPAHGTVGYDEYGNYTYTATDPLFTGADSFQYTVSDGYTGGTATYTVTVDVTNSGPTAGGDSLMTHTDPVTVWVLDNDSDPDWEDTGGLTATLATGPQHGTVSAGSGGSFTYTPDAGYAGPDSFTYTLSDEHGGTATGTVDVTVTNTPAAASGQAFMMDEDGGTLSGSVLMNGSTDEDGDDLEVTLTVAPPSSAGSFSMDLSGNFSYTPAADFFGTVSFKYTVDDGYGATAEITSTIDVAPVNDAPSFTKGADQTVDENAGPQSISGWATSLSKGPANESGQTLSFYVTADDSNLFSSGPAIDANGKLTFTPAEGTYGTTDVTVYLMDSGGSDNGGVDMSSSQTFTITINARTTGELAGSVYDINTEDGVGDVLVAVLDGSSNVIAFTSTDENGVYSFEELPAGSYTIDLMTQGFYVFDSSHTTTTSIGVTVVARETTPIDPIGVVEMGGVGGTVFDGNTSAGMAWAEVEVIDQLSNVVRSVVTDGSGTYSFSGLDAGTYTISFTVPSPYLFSLSSAATWTTSITITGGSSITQNATAAQPAGTVSGIVWTDMAADGQQNAGDTSRGGVTVSLYDQNSNLVGTSVVTGPDGGYEFTGLPPATYTVEFTAPSGVVFEANKLPSWSCLVDLSTVSAADVSPATYEPVTVSGVVWDDQDPDGLKGTTESGVSNATVTLLDANGDAIGSPITTNSLGEYSFANLTPGSYGFRFEVPQGYYVGVLGESTAEYARDLLSGINQTLSVAAAQNMQLTVDLKTIGDIVAQSANVPATKRQLDIRKAAGMDFTVAGLANSKAEGLTRPANGGSVGSFLLGYVFKANNIGQGDSVIQTVTVELTPYDANGKIVQKDIVTESFVEGFEIVNGETFIDVHSGVAPAWGEYSKVIYKQTMVAYIGKYNNGTQNVGVGANERWKIFGKGADKFNNIVQTPGTNKVEIEISYEITQNGKYKLVSKALKVDKSN